MISALRGLAISLAAVLLSTASGSAEQSDFIVRGVFADDRLWFLLDSGALSSIAPDGDVRIDERGPSRVLDLCVLEAHPAMIVGSAAGPWTVRRHEAGAWRDLTTVAADGDALRGASCSGGRLMRLTTRRLIEIDPSGQRAVVLSGALGRGRITAIHAEADDVFVGFNAGEWGGGLRRIDRATGKIANVEQRASGDACAGPLNADCDPVNGIADLPWRPGCIVVAIGLVHVAEHGRLVEVCGDRVREIYRKDHANGQVGFYGLAASNGAVVAVGSDGLYRLEASGSATPTGMPRFRTFGAISASFDLADFVLVLTRINQRLSVGGLVPILVPR